MIAVRMSLRLFAILALLLGLVMWIFGLEFPLVYVHIVCAVLVLVLSVVVLFLPATVNGNNSTVRMFQGLTVLFAVLTIIVGYLQYSNGISVASTIIHLILALLLVGLIEMTIGRQNRIARAARADRVEAKVQ